MVFKYILAHFHNVFKTWYRALDTTDSLKIIRRYAIMNSFDGALATFGILLANYLSGVKDPGLIFFVGMSSGISMGISGFWGTFFIEQAEQKKEMRKMERHMLTNMGNKFMGFAYSFSSKITTIVNSSAPLTAAFFILLPFLFLQIETAYYVSFGLAVVVFIMLGIAMGRIANENMAVYALKFILAAVAALVVLYFFNAAYGVSVIA